MTEANFFAFEKFLFVERHFIDLVRRQHDQIVGPRPDRPRTIVPKHKERGSLFH